MPGYNDSPTELTKMKEIIEKIKPDSIQLNSLDRPGTVSRLRGATWTELQEIVNYWQLNNVEIISSVKNRKKMQTYRIDIESAIIETITRRPCTLDDLSKILGNHISEINKYLDVLEADKKIETIEQDRGIFYQIKKEK